MSLLKSILRPALVTAAILLLPLAAMRFNPNSGVNWTGFDFAFAGTLLFGTGLAYELLFRRGGNVWYRLGAALALIGALFLIIVNGAVGIIGSENNPANLLFAGVLAVVFVGAGVARLRAEGLARTMFAAALLQLLIPVLALLIWQLELGPDMLKTFAGNALFVGLWLTAGLLFRRAGGERQSAQLA